MRGAPRLAVAALGMARLARAVGARAALAPAELMPHVTISVVIPARDEAARIGRCLTALRAAPGVDEVLVVDDDSTDATAAIARNHGATVVEAGSLPTGWAGKCWALQRGIEHATGEWIVTLDADTIPDARLPAAAVARALADGWDLLTLAPRFECPGVALQVLHPALLTTLVYRFGSPGARRLPRPGRTLANGQCQVVRRRELLDAGGLERVAGSLVEDVALARTLAGDGWSIGFLDGTELLSVRMHESARDAWRAWGRSLPLADVTSPSAQVVDLATVWFALALPLPRLLARRGDGLDLVLAAARLGTLVGTRRAYARTGIAYWCSPLADLAAAVRLTQRTLRPDRSWRGRSYPTGGPGRSARRSAS